MDELLILREQVSAIDRCVANLERAKENLKIVSGRKLFYPTCAAYNEAVVLAQENVVMAQDTLDRQIRINSYANGFTREMEESL